MASCYMLRQLEISTMQKYVPKLTFDVILPASLMLDSEFAQVTLMDFLGVRVHAGALERMPRFTEIRT